MTETTLIVIVVAILINNAMIIGYSIYKNERRIKENDKRIYKSVGNNARDWNRINNNKPAKYRHNVSSR